MVWTDVYVHCWIIWLSVRQECIFLSVKSCIKASTVCKLASMITFNPQSLNILSTILFSLSISRQERPLKSANSSSLCKQNVLLWITFFNLFKIKVPNSSHTSGPLISCLVICFAKCAVFINKCSVTEG